MSRHNKSRWGWDGLERQLEGRDLAYRLLQSNQQYDLLPLDNRWWRLLLTEPKGPSILQLKGGWPTGFGIGLIRALQEISHHFATLTAKYLLYPTADRHVSAAVLISQSKATGLPGQLRLHQSRPKLLVSSSRTEQPQRRGCLGKYLLLMPVVILTNAEANSDFTN